MKNNVPVQPRPISLAEASVVKAMLSVASLEADGTERRAGVEALVVVGRCTCGCDTVDFQSTANPGTGYPIADGLGRTEAGHPVGVIVFGTDAEITGLEIYEALGLRRGDLRLPRPETIHGWADPRLE